MLCEHGSPKSGNVKIPLLGPMNVTGVTAKQLSEKLEAAYFDGYLVNPIVTVTIEEFRPFYIKGAVAASGAYKFDYDLTVDQAIAIAGGLKDRASRSEWFIVRGPQKRKFKVTRETKVFPGDTIEIEESLF